MSFARFQTQADAQAYADAVQAELCKNPKYIAPRWSDVYTGTDNAFYVYSHPQVIPMGSTYIEQTDEEGNVHQALQLPEGVSYASDIPQPEQEGNE